MKIAVLGWYGHDNAGDERIKFCLTHFLMSLGGITNVDFFDLHDHAIKGKTNQFDHYDLVIIGGGGLILSHHNYHDFILGIKTKIITAGISVETELRGNPKKFAIALLEKSNAVLVRDQGSYEKLNGIDINGKVQLSSDLTFLSPYEVVNTNEESTIGVNLMAKTNHSRLMLKSLLFASRFINGFSPKTIDFSPLIENIEKLGNIMPIPLYCVKQESGLPEHQMNDVHCLRKYFREVPSFFNHADIDKSQILLSMRLHGLIFAVQKGIPILTFSSYPKQINFMKELGIENCLIHLNHLENTRNVMQYIVKNTSLIKEKIMIYRDKAVKNIRNDFVEAINKSLCK